MIRTDLQGLIDNLSILPRRHALQPIFEAVSNALYAIQAADKDNGIIQIELIRNPAQASLPIPDTDGDDSERSTLPEITSVRITDNGIGFNKDNYDSFCEVGSRYKADIGGKGMGRLMWLKAFKRVQIYSVYHESDALRRRQFSFQLPDGVIDNVDEETDALETATTVLLSETNPDFAPYLRHRASTIRNEIVRHFLSYFLASKPAQIEVIDGEEHLTVSLKGTEKVRTTFSLRDNDFAIDHLKIQTPAARQHIINYCADSRVVKTERIKHLPPSRLQDDGNEFYYHAYVTSEYLDKNANLERTGFLIDEEASLVDEVSFSNLRAEIETSASNFLEPYISALRTEQETRISNVIDNRFPEYRYVRKHNPDALQRIPVHATETEIESTIANIHFNNQKAGRALLDSVVEELKNVGSFDADSFAEQFEERFERLNEVNQASLLSYLLFRRSIIDLYEQVLRKSEDKYQREAALHSLIFPMGRDHETAEAFLEHNLWLIDERLTYASYIASDKQIRQHKVLFNSDDRGEPDLAIYFNLGFSSDELDGPLHNVVIVEFKRPGPLDRRDENPYQQVLRYIRKIKEGFYNEAGTRIRGSDGTRFYCYIVCEVDDREIRRLIDEYQFKPLFDGEEGYFLYNEPLRAHVELVPFEKILRDAKRNHKAFFERMGLLTTK